MIQCPSCGGGLRFEIETQKMVCDLCGSHFDPQSINTESGDSTEVGVNAYDVAVHICPSCGAELLTNDANDAVGFCPFCGGASMIYSQIRQQWKPDAVLPFKITKEQCKEAYLKEAKNSPFVRNVYRDPALLESFRGIYMPFWIIDTEYDDDYEIRVKTYEPDKEFYECQFTGHAKGTARYVHDASLSFSDDISESLAPYPAKDSKQFSTGYLAGFYTEIADVSEEEYNEQVDEIIRANQAVPIICTSAFRAGVPDGTVVYGLSMEKEMTPSKTQVMRGLFPVWFMSRRNKDTVTYAAVNGATGKVAVDLPLSPIKILITALVAAGLLFLISLLLPTIKAVECIGVCAYFMASGLLIMENAYQSVMQSKLSMNVPKWKRKVPFLIVLTGLILTFVFSLFGSAFLMIIFLFFLIIAMIILSADAQKINKEMKKPRHLRYRAGLIQEVNKYKPARWLFYGLGFTMIAGTVIIILLNPPAAIYMYALCVLMTANLFGAAFLHIRFQVRLSMRRPPQMNKKGALYDEN